MKLRYLLLSLCVLLTMGSCQQKKEKFTVSGQITDAQEEMLYFEALSLNGTQELDSVRLDQNGRFSFQSARPGNPEFYRLRLGQQIINLAVDSTESIRITARAADMGAHYTVEGSKECLTLQKIGQKQQETEQAIRKIAEDPQLTTGEKARKIAVLIRNYKAMVRQDFILSDPAAASSYFALFQTINGDLIFDPVNDAEDVRWFAAVATAWDNLYPGCARSENLKNITLQGQRNTRIQQNKDVEISNEKVKATGIIDINLRNIRGQHKTLSELKGQVVLLDFTAYSLPSSKDRIIKLRELYNAYHAQGLEIYQVSLDKGEHYWKTVSESLPWICVFDPRGTNSDYLLLYNVQELPTSFLIDRNNDLKCRVTPDMDLRGEIEKLL